MTDSPSDRLISVRETAEMFGCSVATIWRRVSDGSLPQPLRLGGITRWSQAELVELIESAKAERKAA